jgi:hypothetical protein
VLLAVQTVWPVVGFDAQELTMVPVGIRVFVILVPSTFTTATPVVPNDHDPLGTYETTFAPETSTDRELDG